MTEKDYQEIDKALKGLNKQELMELAKITLISRKKNVIRVLKSRAKKNDK